jgi:acetyl-CoA acyltransferase
VGIAARAIKSGDQQLVIAGGDESMSRALFVMVKTSTAFSRNAEMFDTTIGWRFVNKLLQKQYGIDSMPETAENLAEKYNISREDLDEFAWRSQQKAVQAQESGRFVDEIVPVRIAHRNTDTLLVEQDEHPRPDTKL